MTSRRKVGSSPRSARDEAHEAILSERETREILPQSIELPKLRRTRGGEITHLREERTFVVVDLTHHFGNQEIEVGIALPVRVGAQVHGHAVDVDGKIRPMIEIEAAQEILVRRAAAGMLRDHDARNYLEQFAPTQKRARIQLRGAHDSL